MNEGKGMVKETERDNLIDILRGFAIILVVLGHCIQEGSGMAYSENMLYFQDKGYQFLYAFHMPMFMMISGYLAYNSINRITSKKMMLNAILNKGAAYILPIFFWSAIDQIRISIQNYYLGYMELPKRILKHFFIMFLTNFWFLWAVFFFFCYMLLFHFIEKYRIWGYLITFFIMFVTPDGLGFGIYKYMLPFYLIAYHVHQFEKEKMEKEFLDRTKKYLSIFMCGIGVIFFILFGFFQEKYFIYVSGYKILEKNVTEQILIDSYRFLLGLSGSIFFILFLKRLYSFIPEKYFSLLSYLGRQSLGIYILSGYVIIFFIKKFSILEKADYVGHFIQLIIVLVISCMIIEIMKRIPIMKYMIGQK